MENEEQDKTTTQEEVEKPEKEKVEKPVDTSNFDAKIAAKDAEIKRLNEAWLADKNSQHMTKEDVRRSQEALATAVRERSQIEKDKDIIIKETQDKLDTVSQATQTLSTEKTELTEKYELSEAKATKLEVLTEEFPELLRYAKLIPASKDAEVVREACKTLSEARKADLEAQRIGAVTGASNPSGAQRAVESPITDPVKMREYLDGAKKDPKEYEKRRQVLLDSYDSSLRQRAS
jgi:hypothetical protein